MASTVSRSRTMKKKSRKKATDSELKLANVTCPVCLSILIEPVTMPCSHELCMPCFKQYVEETSLLCPVCRKRISTWARQASREGTLINKRRWKMIKQCFPENVKRRLNGDESDDENRNSATSAQIKLSMPGEIRKEYEDQLKRLQEEIAKQREQEAQRSEIFIKELQAKEQEEDEKRKLENQRLEEKDRQLALLISQQLNETILESETSVINTTVDEPGAIASTSFEKYKGDEPRNVSCKRSCDTEENVVAKNPRPGLSKKECLCKGKSSRADSVTSDDSITPELYHFRPIKAAPKTPPRRVRNEKKKNSTETSTTSSSSSLPPAKSKVAVQLCLTKEVENVETPALKRRLLTIEIDRKKKRKRLALQKCRENINDPVPTPPHAVAVDAVENAACHLNGAATFLCKKWTKLQKRKPLASTNGAVSQPSLPQRKNCWHSNNARPVLATPKYTPHTTAITAMLLAKRRKKLSENQKKFKLNNGTYVKKRKGDTMYNRRHNDTQTSVTTNHDKGPKPPELDINSNECTIESGPSASGDNNNTNSTGLNSRLTKLMKQQQEDSDRLFAIQLMEEEELEYRNFLKCGRSKYNLRKRYHPYTTGKS